MGPNGLRNLPNSLSPVRPLGFWAARFFIEHPWQIAFKFPFHLTGGTGNQEGQFLPGT